MTFLTVLFNTNYTNFLENHAECIIDFSKPQAATNFTNHPDGFREIRCAVGALCNTFSRCIAFEKIRVIRV